MPAVPPYAKVLAVAVAAARAAGALLRAEFERPGGPRGSGDHADADTEAEWLIRERLLAATDWCYLGEETGAVAGNDAAHRWLVDPNDGTVAFLKGFRGSAVSIGALCDGRPVLGVVYAYTYPDGDGDLIAWAEGAGPITRNGVPLSASLAAATLTRDAVVVVSQGADSSAAANARCVEPARFWAMPSVAYRLALTAAGEAVAGVALAGCGAWDYAAGHALLCGAGGVLVDETGAPIVYAADGTSRVARCFGGAPSVVNELCRRPWDEVMSGRRRAGDAVFSLTRLDKGSSVADAARLRRAQGCLVGQVAGDALGALVEFRDARSIRAQYPDGVRVLADGGTHDTIAGQPTDDSELALMLARTLVRDRRYLPASALEAYRHWVRSSPFDVGQATRAALEGAGPLAGSKANGSLMRVSPLGIFGAGRPAEAAAWARLDSALTHPDPACVESCAAFVAAIACAIDGATAKAAHGVALETARAGGEPSVVAALEAARHAAPEDTMTHMGFVLIALQNAFYQLLHAPSFEAGVVDTVMRGGDTDTNGAIAGALLGALHGRGAVPDAWRRAVITCRPIPEAGAHRPRPAPFWPVDALPLAETLLLGPSPAPHLETA